VGVVPRIDGSVDSIIDTVSYKERGLNGMVKCFSE
jgi:hypothetical protein